MFRTRQAVIFIAAFFSSTISLFAQERISLNSSEKQVWRLAPADEKGMGADIVPAKDFNDMTWTTAVVPGTVFTAYVNAGAEKDPNWGDNIYKVDQSKYNRNFWYRTTFATPANSAGKVWLQFEGINRKGEVYLNGKRLGLLDGFMQRGKFEVSQLLERQGQNVLSVLVYWPGKPVANHASPTYISSDGWDWMPSVPGLLQGITDDVYLGFSNDLSLEDTWVRSDLPSRDKAFLSIRASIKNNSNERKEGVVNGVINPGNIRFSQPVKLNAGQMTEIALDSARCKELVIQNPRLWWPNGYGSPDLYTLDLTCTIDGKVSDVKQLRFGIRKYSYDTTGGVFHISINGERIFAKGGNWGMSEYLLRCRGAEYDLKVRLHRDMNLNIIRNWIGSVTDEEFYDACDKYGMMVWDDFWLNSHPNLPDDIMAFNANAVEKIKRLRNHPSIAVWCGDNEGYPLPPLNGWLRENVRTFDGGDRWYQPNSHSDALTGSGPWTNAHPNWYFTKYPGGFGGDPGWGFRTEIGTAVFTTFESFKKFMPDSNWWPRNDMWDKHFFGPSAGNGGPDRYFSTINSSYGTATGIEDFCRKAQLVNIETNKALFEGWQHHMWNDASGVMTWMSQSAYPSFVWQTYDYYYDCNGAYWGVKKACEPVHIQWSYADNSVKISNTTPAALKKVTAEVSVYDLQGRKLDRYSRSAQIDAAPNAATSCFTLDFKMENAISAKGAIASSGAAEAPDASSVIDGSNGTRWSSNYSDDEWITVDLGETKEIASVLLNWESAFAKAYKLLVSDSGDNWKEVYSQPEGKGGLELVSIKPVKARYIRMQGIQRATQWGYSLFGMEIFGKAPKTADLSPVHFIRLRLKDETGKLLSENFYWRGGPSADYTSLAKLQPAKLSIRSRWITENGTRKLVAEVRNTGSSIAFAIHLQAVRKTDGERILPAFMDDNYFTLLKGESKIISISFAANGINEKDCTLIAEAYNK